MPRLHASLTVSLVLLSAGAVAGQGVDDVTLDDLKAPPSPAFVLLGVSPSTVERPQAVRPLVVSALSSVASDGFPKNYAAEFAPYWLGTPGLSFDDYYDGKPARDMVRHLSVSIATTPLARVADAGTAIGFGLRTLPLPGRAHPRLAARRADLLKAVTALDAEQGFLESRPRLIALLRAAMQPASKAVDAEIENEANSLQPIVDEATALDLDIRRLRLKLGTGGDPALKAELEKKTQEQRALATKLLEAIAPGSSGVQEAIEARNRVQAVLDRLDTEQRARVAKAEEARRRAALAIQELDNQRVGPLLAVAGALAWDVPADDTTLASLSKAGLWLTPGYRMLRCPTEVTMDCASAVDFLAVVRYTDNRRANVASSSWELGARIVWQAQKQLAISGEFLDRVSGDEDAGRRVVGVAEYHLADSAYLYASFGKDFEEGSTRHNLVSVIGLTFGLGRKPILSN